MRYKERMSGVRTSHLPAVDFSIITAMLILIAMAWAVAKLETSLIKTEKFVPEFTIAGELDVLPVADTALNTDTVKVGEFMSIAKTADIQSAAPASTATIQKIIPAKHYPAGRSLVAPRIIYKSMPDYPARSVENAQQGTAIVSVYILKNGRVGQAQIEQSTGHEMLDSSALAAVSQWIFEPAASSSQITEAWFKIPVKFQLKS
ncbi:MAG: energy transducer TonB [Candidatus Margulisiibacteriota bacterium]